MTTTFYFEIIGYGKTGMGEHAFESPEVAVRSLLERYGDKLLIVYAQESHDTKYNMQVYYHKRPELPYFYGAIAEKVCYEATQAPAIDPSAWRVRYDVRCEEWDKRSCPSVVDANNVRVAIIPQFVDHPGLHDPKAYAIAHLIVNCVALVQRLEQDDNAPLYIQELAASVLHAITEL